MATEITDDYHQPHNFDPNWFKLESKMGIKKFGPFIIQKAVDHKVVTKEEMEGLSEKVRNEKMPSWLALQMVKNVIKLRYVNLYEAGHFDEINKAANKDDSLFNNL